MAGNIKREIKSALLSRDFLLRLPREISKILEILSADPDVIVKGGIAKAVAMAALAKRGDFKDAARLKLELRINDIDLDLVCPVLEESSRSLVREKFAAIESGLRQAGLYLDAKDVELIDAADAAAAAERIINFNDLTINEFLLRSAPEGWVLNFTPQGMRALVDGIGVLNPKPGHIRYDAGRVFPSSLGAIRLLKFLIAGKVEKIYFPRWWRQLYFSDYEKKTAAGESAKGAPLGMHSLVLMSNYFGNDPMARKRAMVALYDLGFTDILDPDFYIRQQEDIIERAHIKFEIKEQAIDETFDKYLENKRKKEENQKNRQIQRGQCAHEYETIDCDLCGRRACKLEYCAKCRRNKEPGLLPCTLAVYRGQTDPSGFYELK